jgi:hypothetical protein
MGDKIKTLPAFDPTGTLEHFAFADPAYWNGNEAEWSETWSRVERGPEASGTAMTAPAAGAPDPLKRSGRHEHCGRNARPSVLLPPSDERADIAVRCAASSSLRRHRRRAPHRPRDPEGSFVTLLGPVGLRQDDDAAHDRGAARSQRGRHLIKGRRIDDVPIHKRNLGLVFQNYALFPHKTMFDNVAFGLKYRDVPKAEIRGASAEALELVQLPQLVEKRYPASCPAASSSASRSPAPS